MRQRKLADVENKARTDIAEAKYRGDVGVKEKERDTRVQTVQFETQAIEVENIRNIEMAKTTAEMKVKKAEYTRQTAIAEIEAKKASQIRESELQRELEIKLIAQETERQRAEVMSKTTVQAEATERLSDAELYKAKREAEAIRARFDAQAEGLRQLLQAAPDSNTVLSYLMIDRNVYPQLAEANAKAINGLQPKITSWTTTEGKSGNVIGDIFKMVPPLVSTIYDQTGIKPPTWMLEMPANGGKSAEKQ